MVKRVGLVSSGTGGHLWPALVLGDALRAGGYDTLFLTAGRAVESELLSRAGQRAQSLEMGGRGVGQLVAMARGTMKARRWLAAEDVDAVVCTGGRTSVAAGLAARSLRLPIAILEQNAVPGRANRLLSRLARRVYLGLPTIADVPHSLVTGTPIRKDFSLVDRQVARQRLGLRDDLPVVLVTGGSQGASFLNEAAPRALLEQRCPMQVLHLSGPRDEADVRARYRDGVDHGVDAVVRALAFDMPTLYAAADLVICRGGGCTVSELIATGRAALIVPYPHHRDQQQLHNARVLARAGAAVVLQQHELTGPRFTEVLQQLLRSPERLRLMEECARSLDLGDACDRIVHDLEQTVL
jgi:UDP-N-acetylglucosamine--N-acetylmuramyl-(pentapeptide) pyrophosphoryl-undecaprenol N-acetylglucosamine transferase